MIPIARNRSTRRRRRIKSIPFESINRLALDAAIDTSITTAGGAVSLWEDIGPSGRDFAAGVTPDHDDANNIVNFNGSNDYLTGGAGLLPATGDFTLVVRASFTGGRSNNFLSNYNHNSTPSTGAWAVYTVYTAGDNIPRFYAAFASGMMLSAASAISPVGLHTITVSRTGNTFAFRTDGGLQSTATRSDSLYTGPPRLGVANTRDYLKGGIQRIGVWGQALSGGDLDAVEDWAVNG